MKRISDHEIIQLTKKLVAHFYNRSIENDIHYLADDFIWIGAFDYQCTLGKKDFLVTIKSELNALPFTMLNEEYHLLSKNKSTIVICAKFKLYAHGENNDYIRTHTRLTIIWNYILSEWKLTHIHGSNAQDVPLLLTEKKELVSPQKDFFKYLTSLESPNDSNKIAFRDTAGIYKYFSPSEILFLEANLQQSILVTIDNHMINISGLLSVQEKKLSNDFYRIHKSYIVNMNYIHSLERYTVILGDNIKLPVSKNKYIDLRTRLSSS